MNLTRGLARFFSVLMMCLVGGCAGITPTLYERYSPAGVPTVGFATEWWKVPAIEVQVLRLPERAPAVRVTFDAADNGRSVVITRHVTFADKLGFSDTTRLRLSDMMTTEIDRPEPLPTEYATFVPLTRPGEYVAELWYHGKRRQSVVYTVEGMHVARAVKRLDRLLALSPAQRSEATAIFRAADADLGLLVTPDAAMVETREIRQRTRTRLRALLTPEQQAIFDANDHVIGQVLAIRPSRGLSDPDVREYVENRIRNSAAIVGRVGQVLSVVSTTSTETTSFSTWQQGAIQGCYRYRIYGSAGSESIAVSWRRSSPNAPICIVKIEAGNEQSLPLPSS